MAERRIKEARFPSVMSLDRGGFYTAAALVHELLDARDEKRLLRLQRRPLTFMNLTLPPIIEVAPH